MSDLYAAQDSIPDSYPEGVDTLVELILGGFSKDEIWSKLGLDPAVNRDGEIAVFYERYPT